MIILTNLKQIRFEKTRGHIHEDIRQFLEAFLQVIYDTSKKSP